MPEDMDEGIEHALGPIRGTSLQPDLDQVQRMCYRGGETARGSSEPEGITDSLLAMLSWLLLPARAMVLELLAVNV